MIDPRDRFVERLERRRLFAAGIDNVGILQIAGTAKNDKIVLSRDKGTRIFVNVNGVTQTFNSGDFTYIAIDTRAGDDVVQILPARNGAPIAQSITVRGGAGNDHFIGGPGPERLLPGEGDDTVEGGDGRDTIYGDLGDDSLRGNGASDLIDGGDGFDTLRGDAGNDNISGGANPDRIRGSAGNDLLQGGGGRDLIGGEAGDDACFGDSGNDIIDGGTGADYVEGGNDHDFLYINDDDGFAMSEALNGECIDAVESSSLHSDAQLDLTDNKLVTNGAVGVWGVTGLIAAGRNGGTWDGSSGIVTNQDNAAGSLYTSIGIAKASDVGSPALATALWDGQTITGTDVLVMYTYGGDANLDGKLNIDDYVKIDPGIAANLWSNGDFNYDGKVNIDDYMMLVDLNIGNQNGFPTSGAEGVTAVSGASLAGNAGVWAYPRRPESPNS